MPGLPKWRGSPHYLGISLSQPYLLRGSSGFFYVFCHHLGSYAEVYQRSTSPKLASFAREMMAWHQGCSRRRVGLYSYNLLRLSLGDEFFIIQAGEADVEVNGKKAVFLWRNLCKSRCFAPALRFTEKVATLKANATWLAGELRAVLGARHKTSGD